jgi:hypothetical protein
MADNAVDDITCAGKCMRETSTISIIIIVINCHGHGWREIWVGRMDVNGGARSAERGGLGWLGCGGGRGLAGGRSRGFGVEGRGPLFLVRFGRPLSVYVLLPLQLYSGRRCCISCRRCFVN